MAGETWTGWCGLSEEDRNRLYSALKGAHLPCFRGGDVVIANSVDFAMLADIMHALGIHPKRGKFRAVAFSDAEVAEWEKKLSKNKNAEFNGHSNDGPENSL